MKIRYGEKLFLMFQGSTEPVVNTSQVLDGVLREKWGVDTAHIMAHERLAVLFVDRVLRNSSPVGIGTRSADKLFAVKQFFENPHGGVFNSRPNWHHIQRTKEVLMRMTGTELALQMKAFNTRSIALHYNGKYPHRLFQLHMTGDVEERKARLLLVHGYRPDTVANAIEWIEKRMDKVSVANFLRAFPQHPNPLLKVTNVHLALSLLPITIEPFKTDVNFVDGVEIASEPRPSIRDPWKRTKFNNVVLRGVECGHRYCLLSILEAIKSRSGPAPCKPLICPYSGCSRSFDSMEKLCIDLNFMRTLIDTKKTPAHLRPAPVVYDDDSSISDDSWSTDPEFEYPESKREAYREVLVRVEAARTRRYMPYVDPAQTIPVRVRKREPDSHQLAATADSLSANPTHDQLYRWAYEKEVIKIWCIQPERVLAERFMGFTLDTFIRREYEFAYKNDTGKEIHLFPSGTFAPLNRNQAPEQPVVEPDHPFTNSYTPSPNPRMQASPSPRPVFPSYSPVGILNHSWMLGCRSPIEQTLPHTDPIEHTEVAPTLGKRTSSEHPTVVPPSKRVVYTLGELIQNANLLHEKQSDDEKTIMSDN